MKRRKKIFYPVDSRSNYAVSDKINRKTDTRDKGHYIITKGSIPQEDATINKYVLREGTR